MSVVGVDGVGRARVADKYERREQLVKRVNTAVGEDSEGVRVERERLWHGRVSDGLVQGMEWEKEGSKEEGRGTTIACILLMMARK